MMRTCGIALALVMGTIAIAADKEKVKVSSPLEFKVKDIDGKELDLASLKGKVVLMVNVASRCGYTPQYEGLQALYDQYGKEGLVVLGVPANEFGKQEPGTDAEIKEFCTANYKVTFPMLAKIVVKGKEQHPLYQYLTSKETNPKFAGDIGWNFEKFLINRKGEVVGRYKSSVGPDNKELTATIEKELKAEK